MCFYEGVDIEVLGASDSEGSTGDLFDSVFVHVMIDNDVGSVLKIDTCAVIFRVEEEDGNFSGVVFGEDTRASCHRSFDFRMLKMGCLEEVLNDRESMIRGTE